MVNNEDIFNHFLTYHQTHILKLEGNKLALVKKNCLAWLFVKIFKDYQLNTITDYFYAHQKDLDPDLFEKIHRLFDEKVDKYNKKHRHQIEIPKDPRKKVFENPYLLSFILRKTGNPSYYAAVNKDFLNATKNGTAHKEIFQEFSKATGLLSDLIEKAKKSLPSFNENEEDCKKVLKIVSIEIIKRAKLYSGNGKILKETGKSGLFEKLSKISTWTEDSILISFFESFYKSNLSLSLPIFQTPVTPVQIRKFLQESLQEYSIISKKVKISYSMGKIHYLPKEIKHFTKIEHLDLFHIELYEIPKEIGDLNSLKTLNLSHNLLEELPIEIGRLTSLQKLDLTGNKIKKIPEAIKNLNANVINDFQKTDRIFICVDFCIKSLIILRKFFKLTRKTLFLSALLAFA